LALDLSCGPVVFNQELGAMVVADDAICQATSAEEVVELERSRCVMTITTISERYLVLSPQVHMESSATDGVVVFHGGTGHRLRLSQGAYRWLRQFRHPVLVEQLSEQRTQGLQSLSLLVEKGFLVEPSAAPLLSTDRKGTLVLPYTLFNSPRAIPVGATDVAVAGVPFDLGNRIAAGARLGPDRVRLHSLQYDYRADVLTGRPQGWFDVERGERILEGVTISDWGDIFFVYGEELEVTYQRIAAVCEKMTRCGSLPVFLGGDHSISYPLVEHAQRRQKTFVFWLDAHTDNAEWTAGQSHHHGSVLTRILSLPNVAGVVQIGHRGFTLGDNSKGPEGRWRTITKRHWEENGNACLFSGVPEGVQCYLSVDVDVFDPAFAPATSTPVPDGFTLEQVRTILRGIAARQKVVGLDLVELNPERDVGNLTAMLACQVLLTALGAITAGCYWTPVAREAETCKVDQCGYTRKEHAL
jgi:agmatinase